MANECKYCTDTIFNEEIRAGSAKDICTVCEHIKKTPEERAIRRKEKMAERQDWNNKVLQKMVTK